MTGAEVGWRRRASGSTLITSKWKTDKKYVPIELAGSGYEKLY